MAKRNRMKAPAEHKPKLVVIDTQTMMVKAFEGRKLAQKAKIEQDADTLAVDLIAEINGFRESADAAIAEAERVEQAKKETGKKLADATAEYEKWFDLLVK